MKKVEKGGGKRERERESADFYCYLL